MNNPHVHAELIKEWADGAEIEYWDTKQNQWLPCGWTGPAWYKYTRYRIKPAKIARKQAQEAWLQYWSNLPLCDSMKIVCDYLFQEE